jgi:hypothetical protein
VLFWALALRLAEQRLATPGACPSTNTGLPDAPESRSAASPANEDLRAAVDAGADALGFVFYPKSPRYVTPERFAALARLPPYVSAVALFVNATVDEVRAVVDAGPVALLQFHGDETPEECARIAAREAPLRAGLPGQSRTRPPPIC